MIRLRIKDFNKIIAEHKLGLYNEPYKIASTLSFLFHKYKNSDSVRAEFYNLVTQRLDSLLIGSPSDLEAERVIIEPKYHSVIEVIAQKHSTKQKTKAAIKSFNKEIFSVFDYDKFCRNYNGYGAYALTKTLKVDVCPYCNRINTNTIYTKNGKTRARLDHWFDKSRYPYFALSLFNLIPSCHVCNSDLKNSKQFKFSDNIHPYTDGFELDYKFRTGVVNINYYSGNPDSLEIKLLKSREISHLKNFKIINNITIFCLEELYNCHKEKAAEIILESDEYSKPYMESTLIPFDVFTSTNEIIRRKFRIRANIEDLGKETFAKLRRDLAEELGLKY